MIAVQCPQCVKRILILETEAGRDVVCPACGERFLADEALTTAPLVDGWSRPADDLEVADPDSAAVPSSVPADLPSDAYLPQASPLHRCAAALIDLAVFLGLVAFAAPKAWAQAIDFLQFPGMPFTLVLVYLWHPFGLGEIALILELPVLMWVLLQSVFIGLQAQSIGKWMLGVKIIVVNGDPPDVIRGMIVRTVTPLALFCILPYLGLLAAIIDALYVFHPDHRCLHDHFAATRVVCCRH